MGVDIVSGRNVVESVTSGVVNSIPIVATVKAVVEVVKPQGGRVLILDSSDGRGVLGASWDVGSILGTITDRFDHIIRAENWEQVAQKLNQIADNGQKIKEVQFWGHGYNGMAKIGEHWLDQNTLANPSWQRLATRNAFESNALWWWRTCCTCKGEAGREFAEYFVKTFNIRMAGHTKDIGLTHPGLVCLKPGEKATWNDEGWHTCVASDMGHHSLGN